MTRTLSLYKVFTLVLAFALQGCTVTSPIPTAGKVPTEDASNLSVLTDFQGASAAVESIDQENREIRLRPAQHPDRGWDCWWYFKVTGIRPGEAITINLGGPMAKWSQPQRAAFSEDGLTWKQVANGKRVGARRQYRQVIRSKQAWFAWGPPFTAEHAKRWLDRIASESKHANLFKHCTSLDGHPTWGVTIGASSSTKASTHGIWINARQHAWESGSSWVCRGLTEWLVSDDPRARKLRALATIHIVPVMDVDNVIRGAGGKDQKPHDHNRDWQTNPHFPAVREAIKKITAMNQQGRFTLYVDLHNPGPAQVAPFFYLPPNELLGPKGQRNHQEFVEASVAEITGPMKLANRQRISGRSYHPLWQRISKNWVVANTSDGVVGVTLETSWNTSNSHPTGYATVGRQLGLAIERYLRKDPKRATESGEKND